MAYRGVLSDMIYAEVELIHRRDVCASLRQAVIRDGSFDPLPRIFKSNKSDQYLGR